MWRLRPRTHRLVVSLASGISLIVLLLATISVFWSFCAILCTDRSHWMVTVGAASVWIDVAFDEQFAKAAPAEGYGTGVYVRRLQDRIVSLVPSVSLAQGEVGIGIPLWLVLAAAMLLIAWLVWHGNRGETQGLCTECGYNLTGLTTERCPECGTRVAIGK